MEIIGNKKEISPDRCEQVMTGWGNFILVEGVRLLREQALNYALYLRRSLPSLFKASFFSLKPSLVLWMALLKSSIDWS